MAPSSFLTFFVSSFSGLRVALASLLLIAVAAFGGQQAYAEELPVLPLTVNVNTADARTIANVLQGIGLSKASAIVAYREQHGAFRTVDSLTAVKGIGNRTLELNSTRILLSQ